MNGAQTNKAMNEKLGKLLCDYLNAFYDKKIIDPYSSFDWSGYYISHN